MAASGDSVLNVVVEAEAPAGASEQKEEKVHWFDRTGLSADFSHINLQDPFNMKQIGTKWYREVRGGTVTFLSMAYIIPMATGMLGTVIPYKQDITVAVAAAACIGSILMGVLSNFPFGLAPGVTPMALFTFTMVLGEGVSWEVALTAVFFSGCIFTITSVLGIRSFLMRIVPRGVSMALGVAVGVFLCFIGFRDMGWVVTNPSTLVALNFPLTIDTNYDAAKMWLSAGVIVITSVLFVLKVPGAPLFGIIFGTLVAWIECWATKDDSYFQYPLGSCGPTFNATEQADAGCSCRVPPRVAQLATIQNTIAVFKWDMVNSAEFWITVITFFYTDVLDSSGTFYAVCKRAGYVGKDGLLPHARTNMAFLADAIASVIGACLGTSTVSTFVESCAGVVDGGRTGLVSVTIGIWFALAIPFAPIISNIPDLATAPILPIVGALMMQNIMDFDWNDLEEAFPAFAVITLVPLTFNIANGIIGGVMLWLIIQFLIAPIRILRREDPLIKFKMIASPVEPTMAQINEASLADAPGDGSPAQAQGPRFTKTESDVEMSQRMA